MNYNFSLGRTEYNYDEYSMLIQMNKIQYKRQQHVKHNFRTFLTDEDLNDGIIINFPYNNIYYSYKCNTQAIPLNRYFKRAGIIPFTTVLEKDEETGVLSHIKYYCMAIDAKYGNLTDFGGGVKKYETFAGAAARELKEESLGVFNISSDAVYNCSNAVYDNNMVVLFCQIKFDNKYTTFENIDLLTSDYFKRLSSVNNSETRGIMWIRENIFYNLIKSGKTIRLDDIIYPSVYKNVSDLLRSVSNINEIV